MKIPAHTVYNGISVWAFLRLKAMQAMMKIVLLCIKDKKGFTYCLFNENEK